MKTGTMNLNPELTYKELKNYLMATHLNLKPEIVENMEFEEYEFGHATCNTEFVTAKLEVKKAIKFAEYGEGGVILLKVEEGKYSYVAEEGEWKEEEAKGKYFVIVRRTWHEYAGEHSVTYYKYEILSFESKEKAVSEFMWQVECASSAEAEYIVEKPQVALLPQILSLNCTLVGCCFREPKLLIQVSPKKLLAVLLYGYLTHGALTLERLISRLVECKVLKPEAREELVSKIVNVPLPLLKVLYHYYASEIGHERVKELFSKLSEPVHSCEYYVELLHPYLCP